MSFPKRAFPSYAVSAALTAIANAVWTSASRTLTMPVEQILAVMTGTALVIHRGDTLSVSLTGLGSLTSRSKLWFTIKRTADDIDDEARLFIEETAGLTRLNGEVHVATADGDITVDDATAGNITITAKAAVTAMLSDYRKAAYDIQVLHTDGMVRTLTSGLVSITADVTRATA